MWLSYEKLKCCNQVHAMLLIRIYSAKAQKNLTTRRISNIEMSYSNIYKAKIRENKFKSFLFVLCSFM